MHNVEELERALEIFRLFYQTYPDRLGIRHTAGDESEKSYLSGDEFELIFHLLLRAKRSAPRLIPEALLVPLPRADARKARKGT
jgi:hypothetical protein